MHPIGNGSSTRLVPFGNQMLSVRASGTNVFVEDTSPQGTVGMVQLRHVLHQANVTNTDALLTSCKLSPSPAAPLIKMHTVGKNRELVYHMQRYCRGEDMSAMPPFVLVPDQVDPQPEPVAPAPVQLQQAAAARLPEVDE